MRLIIAILYMVVSVSAAWALAKSADKKDRELRARWEADCEKIFQAQKKRYLERKYLQ